MQHVCTLWHIQYMLTSLCHCQDELSAAAVSSCFELKMCVLVGQEPQIRQSLSKFIYIAHFSNKATWQVLYIKHKNAKESQSKITFKHTILKQVIQKHKDEAKDVQKQS